MQVLLFLLISLLVTNSAFAQNLKPPASASSQTEPPRGKGTGADGNKPSSQPGQPSAQANSAEEMRLDKNKVAILIKSTLLALHHANLTGFYSVLRDLGTPVFREKFDQVRLAQIFADLRTRKINLSVTALASMTLAKSPEYTKDRELNFKVFLTPSHCVFSLISLFFRSTTSGGLPASRWMLYLRKIAHFPKHK